MQGLIANDEKAKKIAMAGYDYVNKNFTMDSVNEYWCALLDDYHRLLRDDVHRSRW